MPSVHTAAAVAVYAVHVGNRRMRGSMFVVGDGGGSTRGSQANSNSKQTAVGSTAPVTEPRDPWRRRCAHTCQLLFSSGDRPQPKRGQEEATGNETQQAQQGRTKIWQTWGARRQKAFGADAKQQQFALPFTTDATRTRASVLGRDCSPRMCRPRSSCRSGRRGLLLLRSSPEGQGRRHERVRLRIQCMQGRQHGCGLSQHGRRLLEFHVRAEAEKILLCLRAVPTHRNTPLSLCAQNACRKGSDTKGRATRGAII